MFLCYVPAPILLCVQWRDSLNGHMVPADKTKREALTGCGLCAHTVSLKWGGEY